MATQSLEALARETAIDIAAHVLDHGSVLDPRAWTDMIHRTLKTVRERAVEEAARIAKEQQAKYRGTAAALLTVKGCCADIAAAIKALSPSKVMGEDAENIGTVARSFHEQASERAKAGMTHKEHPPTPGDGGLPKFACMTRVRKPHGYRFLGRVVASFVTLDEYELPPRLKYVVQQDETGLLFICSEGQLELSGSPPQAGQEGE